MEERERDQPLASSLKTAALTGKTLADIGRGAASGGIYGAALGTASASGKWIPALTALLLLPVVLLTMLPSVIFGPLLGDGGETVSGFADHAVLMQNLTDLNEAVSAVLSEGLNNVLEQIDEDFASSGCDEKEIINPYASSIIFNANALISVYCASQTGSVGSMDAKDMENTLREHVEKFYSFTYTDEERSVLKEEETIITVRVYTIAYNGETYLADEIYALTEEQKTLAGHYAQNLSVFLSDGVYQALSETEFFSLTDSYAGIVFTDGATQTVYYNQLDERWKNQPYGTDNIGGYGCGPTAMAMVVSSLTDDTADPPHMAQWAWENGYWCSGSGSYHSLIPGAAEAWGLSVEGCSASEPQRIVDALSQGKLIVAIMSRGHFTKSGHFIVLRGVTAGGGILVADPVSRQRSEKEWELSIILNEASRNAGAGGPFWIIGR